MHVKVDEDLPPVAAEWLRGQGFEASTVIAQGTGGWKDATLWKAVQVEAQFLLTAEKGFADTRLYPPGSDGGILLLRPDQDGIRPVLDLLQSVLSEVDLAQLEGLVTVATPHGLRVRRP